MTKREMVCAVCAAHSAPVGWNTREAARLFNAGWGSYGNELYCPRCTESWQQHNPDRLLNSRLVTMLNILERIPK